MGHSHPSNAERMGQDAEGLPRWYKPRGLKTKFDFPKAKEGRRDRMEFPVGQREAGKPRRLDKYLLERFPGYSRSFLQQLIKDGSVLIDGKRTKSSWHVTQHEIVTILLPEGARHEAEEIPFGVLYEDPWILALDKPPGIIVHPARGHKTGTLYHGLLHYFRERRASDPSFRVGTVHRLDEETSGVMVYALEKRAHSELTRQFENRLVRKTYLCIAHGAPGFKEIDVDAPLGVDPECRVRVAVDGLEARPAQTRYEVLGISPCGGFSLLRAFPRTGRSHQIRVHAKHLGLPLVGDELYGGLKDDAAFGEYRPRVCLHAESLALMHPHKGDPMLLRAPFPPDLASLAERLGLPNVTGNA